MNENCLVVSERHRVENADDSMTGEIAQKGVDWTDPLSTSPDQGTSGQLAQLIF